MKLSPYQRQLGRTLVWLERTVLGIVVAAFTQSLVTQSLPWSGWFFLLACVFIVLGYWMVRFRHELAVVGRSQRPPRFTRLLWTARFGPTMLLVNGGVCFVLGILMLGSFLVNTVRP